MRRNKGTAHAAPRQGDVLTACCGKYPQQLPVGDRIVLDQDKVTCGK